MRQLLPLRLLALAVLVVACGGGSASQSGSGTSALSFQVVWDRPDYQKASLTDCADVALVSAAVYSDAGALLGQGGPWDCATGSGVISGLPANYYATIEVTGAGPDGSPLYFGQSGTLFLNPGSVDGGVITAGPFVSELLSPDDASIVAPNALTLQWAALSGATSYLVTIASADTFAPETIIGQYSVVGHDVASFQPDITGLQLDLPYFWRVQALSGSGQSGGYSATRQFSLREVVITEVTFVGDDAAGVPSPVHTTVRFAYSTIDYTQVRNGAVIAQWSATMASNDYFALQQIITSYELMSQGDITYTPMPCAGWSGLDVSMVYNANPYGFSISASVCNSAEWPTGVSSLRTLKSDLVTKYQP